MRCLAGSLSVATAFLAVMAHADVRPLSDAEKESLLMAARTSDVVDAYAEGDGERWLRYAIVAYRGGPMNNGACIATTVDYMALPGVETRWEPVFDSVAYRYWPNKSDCVDPGAPGSIRLGTLIDTDTLDRIVLATPQILGAVGALPAQGAGWKLVAIGVEYDDADRTFLYRADYTGSEGCPGIRVHLRAHDKIEFVRVVPTTCETREYLDSIR